MRAKIKASMSDEIEVKWIISVVCDFFNIPEGSIQTETRKRSILQPRQIAMYFAKKRTKLSLAVIGALIGNKDHATVLSARSTVNDLIDTDSSFRGDMEEIERLLNHTQQNKYIGESGTRLTPSQLLAHYESIIDMQKTVIRRKYNSKNKSKLITIKRKKKHANMVRV